MITPTNDTYKLRRLVFFYYLIAMTIIPFIVVVLGILGIGFDMVTPICKDIEKEIKKKDPDGKYDDNICKAGIKVIIAVYLLITDLSKLYFSYIFKQWADYKRKGEYEKLS